MNIFHSYLSWFPIWLPDRSRLAPECQPKASRQRPESVRRSHYLAPQREVPTPQGERPTPDLRVPTSMRISSCLILLLPDWHCLNPCYDQMLDRHVGNFS